MYWPGAYMPDQLVSRPGFSAPDLPPDLLVSSSSPTHSPARHQYMPDQLVSHMCLFSPAFMSSSLLQAFPRPDPGVYGPCVVLENVLPPQLS